jgi:hypothetical protein
MTSDIAATETVVAIEIARLRMKVRENNVILSPNGTSIARVDFHGPARRFPHSSGRLAQRPTGLEPLQHGGATRCSQLNIDLES